MSGGWLNANIVHIVLVCQGFLSAEGGSEISYIIVMCERSLNKGPLSNTAHNKTYICSSPPLLCILMVSLLRF